MVKSSGHGFMDAKAQAFQILEKRAVELGVEIEHDVVIDSIEPYQDADLIAAGNYYLFYPRGSPGNVRRRCCFRPNKFVWLGSTKEFDSFTFYFNENEHGLWRGHCYQYMPGASLYRGMHG